MKSVVFCSLLIVVFVLYQKEKIGSVPIDCQGSVSKITAVRTLEKAMESGLENTIHHAVSQIRCVFNVVNVERPEEYITTITPQPPLTTEEKSQSLDTMWTAAEKRFWWGTRNKKPEALRIPAEVIMAAIAAQHMPNRDHLRDLKIALDAAEYLLLAQKQAGSGVFGFPLHPRSGSHSEKLIEPFNKKFFRQKDRDRFTKNNWIIEDDRRGDLNYDNGLAGQSLIALYEITGEKRLLDGAIRAGEWALTRPLVANFNYNGFSAALFADLYRVTQHEKWMHAAIHYAKLGVLSGQNVMGHNTGDWPDPHNQRLVYRILMIAQLADVLKALPLDNVDRSWIKDGMDHALESVEKQQRNHGGLGNVNSALIMYCKLASISDHYLSSDISLLLQNFLAQSIREQRMPSALYGTICMFNL